MCIIFGKKKPIKRISKSRIPIVKYCYLDDGVIHSLYKGKTYILHKEYHTVLQQVPKETPHRTYFLEVGFHSYHNNVWHQTVTCTIPPVYSKTIHILSQIRSTIYSLDYIRDYTISPIVKVYGYIPKGAEYFRNDRGEYISNKIVLTNYEEVFSTN